MNSSADHNENTTCANSTDDAAAVATSSMAVLPSATQVTQLQRELHDCQQKFESWKVKTKAGVDQMRSQIVDLTRALNQSKTEREHLAALAYWTDAPTALYVSQVQELMYAHSMAAACLLLDAVLFSDTGDGQLQCDGTAVTSLPGIRFLKHAIPQISQKTMDDQSVRLKEVRCALQQTTAELQQRTEALRQQDKNVAELRRRLTASDACKTSLEQQLLSAPKAEQLRQAQEELDQQLMRMQLEYERRESQLVIQHSTELHALNASHEEEIKEMEREKNEAISQALRHITVSGAQRPAGVGACSSGECDRNTNGDHSGRTNDDAYMDLLNDFKKIKMRCTVVTEERDAMKAKQKELLYELQGLLRCTARPSFTSEVSNAPGIVTAATYHNEIAVKCDSLTDSATLEDVAHLIREQRLRYTALQEELVRARREVAELRRSTAGHSADVLNMQQVQYLRSVVARLLCSLSDTKVVRHLLPVLSTLLRFSDDELTSISKAIPQ